MPSTTPSKKGERAARDAATPAAPTVASSTAAKAAGTVPAPTPATPKPDGASSPYAAYLLHLMACALHNEAPAAPTAAISWPALHAIARANSIEGLTWSSTRAFAAQMPDGLAEEWAREADVTLYRRVGFDVEREEVQADLAAAGISTLPLKGCVVAPLYPDASMRSMCDNDILYGRVRRGDDGHWAASDPQACMRELVGIMEARGYTAESVGHCHHDGFQKAPFFNFEMHRELASSTLEWSSYYENPWSKAIQDPENPHRFTFAREDVYIFHIAHSFKHYDGAACGARSVADERVLLDSWGDGLDWPYVEGELAKLGMTTYEEALRRLALEGLAPGSAPDAAGVESELLRMFARMLGAGTYGTVSTRVDRGLEKAHGKKLSYLRKRLYPGFEVVAGNWPIVAKLPFLYPVSPVMRIANGLRLHAGQLAAELREIVRQ